MNVLIIEDEPHAQEELIRLLDGTNGDYEVLACIDSVEESVEWLEENDPPDLVFLDIQLADGLSFRIFEQVEVKAPVIFTTAYDQYAIQAFKLNSIDYLLKPVEPEGLEKALEKHREWGERFGSFSGSFLSEQQLKELLQLAKPTYKKRFLARSGDQISHIPVEEVAYFYADDNLVFLLTKDRKRHLIDMKLEEVERQVDPTRFFRLNRTYISSIEAIKKTRKYFNSRLKVELEPPANDEILVSRAKVPNFISWMDQ